MSETVKIRWATRDDTPEILAMVQELADFEKATHRLHATEESLAGSLSFAPDFKGGFCKTLLLTTTSTTSTSATASDPAYPEAQVEVSKVCRIAGMALYFHNYSTWLATPGIYLEDLFIRPEFRRKGYATMLLKRLAEEVSEISNGKGRLEWSCLRWNQNALDFYQRVGAVQMTEWVGLRVEGDRLRKLASIDARKHAAESRD